MFQGTSEAKSMDDIYVDTLYEGASNHHRAVKECEDGQRQNVVIF